ncbi:unnamed protein product, partial [Eruca vesicaria subsp. sativa]|nr:unnamed protein product [Eruca vesicaria subsp. sativa]
MNTDGTWLHNTGGERSQVGDNDETNQEANWFNNPQPLPHGSQNDFRFNTGGFPLNPSENLLLLLQQQQSIDTSSPLQHFTLDPPPPQQQQQEQSFLATKSCFTSLLNVPTSNTNNNPFDELGFSSGVLGQLHGNSLSFSTLSSLPNTTEVGNRFTPLEFAGVSNSVFENRAKVLKPLDVLASSSSQPTLFQKRAAMRQTSSNKTCNSESSSEMRRSSYERENLDDASTGIMDNISDEHNNKGKKKGMPAKNLMAERRRRKKLNDRLYML